MTQDSSTDPQAHWEDVYRRKDSAAVSWYRPHLDTSLDLLAAAGLSPQSRVIDVGGGASTLADDLLGLGVSRLTVLDLSSQALAVARHRLGRAGESVQWLCADLLSVSLPEAGFDLWHDRAVLHFLNTPEATARYAAQATQAIRPGGQAVIGGFAPEGPERCSGLAVVRRSAPEVAALLGPAFSLAEHRHEVHLTPGGTAQSFTWARLVRTTSL